ncbi:2-succinyl-6-hydroxy-2,4-cyclohexadiene-1-carboxylate synthase [Sediminibacillus massiliensis]|uniref:2-succinyl-6-hydroxy-2, 4-cyclohexadiene-1-carboxylate synthase n=1 Tax=Sediminibacillus massiliensis TaxID=1926277 RepID=UPI001FE8692B|nr:2-succinyl-6-hydroxy-2,4-cyclohexadiene-1-carboxylate synthase [Sediminibacillus massiliensis]
MYTSVGEHSYWIKDTGRGPAVLLLHGFTGTSGTWDAVIEKLEPNFRVLVIDLPGHGLTRTNGIVGMELFCEHLCTLLDLWNVPRVHLIGYSLGGRTALSFASFYPDRVSSIVLESSSPGLADNVERLDRKYRDEVLADRLEEDGLEAFVDYWENIPLFDSQKKLPAIVRERIRRERLGQTETGLANSLRGMGTGAQPSWWDTLHSISFPVLILAGELDEKFAAIGKRMNQLIPNSILKTIPDTGHAIHVEQPAKFVTIVNGFLQKLVD